MLCFVQGMTEGLLFASCLTMLPVTEAMDTGQLYSCMQLWLYSSNRASVKLQDISPHVQMESTVFQILPVVSGCWAPQDRAWPHPLDTCPLDIYKLR